MVTSDLPTPPLLPPTTYIALLIECAPKFVLGLAGLGRTTRVGRPAPATPWASSRQSWKGMGSALEELGGYRKCSTCSCVPSPGGLFNRSGSLASAKPDPRGSAQNMTDRQPGSRCKAVTRSV